MRTLADIPVGETVTVENIGGGGPIRRRILDMGITRGVSLFVHKTAPLGDPLEIHLRGYALTLRKEDAKHIEVRHT